MDDPKVHGKRVFVLALACLGVIQSCEYTKIPQCEGFNSISGIAFHAFIPENTFDKVCSHLQTAMSCTYQYLQDCPAYVTFPFDTQKGVIDAVCGEKRKAYLKSMSCFNQRNLKESVLQQCMTAMLSVTVGTKCSYLASISECARSTTMMYDGCSASDADFMQELTDIYLQPTAKYYKLNCISNNAAATEKPESAISTMSEKESTTELTRVNEKTGETKMTESTTELTPANEKADEKNLTTTATHENKDNKDFEQDNYTAYTAMSRLRGSTHQLLNSTSEESETEDETPGFAASRRSKSKGSSKTSKSSSKSSEKSSSSSKIKRTTFGTADRKTSSASNSKMATTVNPNSKQATTSSSKAQGKTTDKAGQEKSGSDVSDKKDRDKSSSNTKGGHALHLGLDDKNEAAALRESGVIWVFMTSLLYVVCGQRW